MQGPCYLDLDLYLFFIFYLFFLFRGILPSDPSKVRLLTLYMCVPSGLNRSYNAYL